MPIPFIPLILGGIALASGATGVKKAIDAKDDYEFANKHNEEASYIINEAEKLVEDNKAKATADLEKYGEIKLNVLSGSIKDFFANIERIKDIENTLNSGYEDLKYFNPKSPSFKELKNVSIEATNILAGGVTALGSGALLAFGTYNVVMGGLGGLLVTATTGTALTSLAGVAATNATLAWLGGGALAAGGLGMAGGMAVLGGIVAGPALLIGGGMAAKKADEAYSQSLENKEKAKTFKKEAETIALSLQLVSKTSIQFQKTLDNLDNLLKDYNNKMSGIINKKGKTFEKYSSVDQKVFYTSMRIASTIKDILEAPILNEDGSYNKGVEVLQQKLDDKFIDFKENYV